jgi:hypothetical protein
MGILGTTGAYGLVASAPPLPAPGRSALDTFGAMSVFRSPLDTLFFHSWPDEINEGLQTQWQDLPFTGASGPLAFVYRGNTWQDYSVKLQMHTSNPLFPALGIKTGSSSIFSVQGAAMAIFDVLRIQMQVAWCKSICLPNGDKMAAAAQAAVKSLLGATGGLREFLSEAANQLKNVFGNVATALSDLTQLGPYAGSIFPPMIMTNYGGFLRLYGFCNSVSIRWLPPFVPFVAYPHRAEVTLNFRRFFPFSKTPSRTLARIQLGVMA